MPQGLQALSSSWICIHVNRKLYVTSQQLYFLCHTPGDAVATCLHVHVIAVVAPMICFQYIKGINIHTVVLMGSLM